MMTATSKNFMLAVERLLASEWDSTLTKIESGSVRGASPRSLLDPGSPIEGWEARDELIKAYLMLKGEMALESSSEPSPTPTKLAHLSPATEPMPMGPNTASLQKHVVPFPSQPSVAASARPQPISISMSQSSAAARAMSIDERNQPLNVPVEQGVIRKVTDEVKPLPQEDERNRPLEVKKQDSSISVSSVSASASVTAKALQQEEKPSSPSIPTVKAPLNAPSSVGSAPTRVPTPSQNPSSRISLPSSLPSAVGSTKVKSKDKVDLTGKSAGGAEQKLETNSIKVGSSNIGGLSQKEEPVSSEVATGNPEVETYRCEVKSISDEEVFAEHAELLAGVKYQRYRDFILAEGKNSGTDAPSLVICTLTNDWLEFQFPYEEGQRLLQKYPQRDQELAHLIVSKSRRKS